MPANTIIQDITFLFELAQSTGRSLNLKDNCDKFLRTIVSRKALDIACIYIFKNLSKTNLASKKKKLVRYHSIPKCSMLPAEIDKKHPFVNSIMMTDTAEYKATELKLVSDGLFPNLNGGFVSFLSLPEVGFLLFHSPLEQNNPIQGKPLLKIQRSSLQLKTSIEGCVAHSFLKKRIKEKKENERKLKEQNKELVKLNQELDRFVYSASHDLRAPLLSILGLVDIIEKTDCEEEKNVCLDHIKKSAFKLDGFIKEIIDISRNNRLDKEYVQIGLKGLVEELTHDLQYINSQAKILIKSNTSDTFTSDEYRLKVMLNNVLSNAFKYVNPVLDEHIVSINIHQNCSNAIIQIKDNGIGIEDKHLDKIFNMFYRATNNQPGSGLGLYIAKETAEKLNGTIDIKSKPGKGTIVTLSIPNHSNGAVQEVEEVA